MAPPDTHAPHVFVESLDAPLIDPDDAHHLGVLRIQRGALVVACDGNGGWRGCRWTGSRLEPDAPIEQTAPPAPRLGVAFALTKGDKADLVVQKLTELGVDWIAPFVAARSVVRWDDERCTRMVSRWRRVAREAAMQSRRLTLPSIGEVGDVASVLDAGFVRADRDGDPISVDRRCVAIGPEGGWSDDERRGPSVRLGPLVLRAETAAIAAATLLTAQRAGIVGTLR